jgi:phenylacetate-CoA ligase
VSERRFWNEEIETLSPPERRRFEGDRLADQMAYLCATSPYYRAKLADAGLVPGDIRHVEDLARVPFMEKSEVAHSQADGTLIGVNQCAPLDRIVRVQATGGTTGQPIRIGLTRRDIEDYGRWARGRCGRWVVDPAKSSSSA